MTNTVEVNPESIMMSNQKEKISSLLDGYLRADENQSVLDELVGDVNQQYRLGRYQLIGDVMRNEVGKNIQLDFAAAVHAHLDNEASLKLQPKQAEQNQPAKSSWFWSMFLKPAAGLAVAAAVAVVTVSIFQLNPANDNQPNQIASNDSSQEKVEQLVNLPVIQNAVRVSGNSQNTSLTTNGTNWKIKRSGPDMQNKLNTYLINHNEYSNSMQGIIPQARVVGFDGQR